MAGCCLWGVAPQCSPSSKCAVLPSSAIGEHWEPRLPAKTGGTQVHPGSGNIGGLSFVDEVIQ